MNNARNVPALTSKVNKRKQATDIIYLSALENGEMQTAKETAISLCILGREEKKLKEEEILA